MLDIEYPTEDTTISVAFTPSQFELLSAIAFIESRTASEQAAYFLKLVLEQHGLAPVTLEQIMGLDEEVEVDGRGHAAFQNSNFVELLERSIERQDRDSRARDTGRAPAGRQTSEIFRHQRVRCSAGLSP